MVERYYSLLRQKIRNPRPLFLARRSMPPEKSQTVLTCSINDVAAEAMNGVRSTLQRNTHPRRVSNHKTEKASFGHQVVAAPTYVHTQLQDALVRRAAARHKNRPPASADRFGTTTAAVGRPSLRLTEALRCRVLAQKPGLSPMTRGVAG